jgi:hypothetical protein
MRIICTTCDRYIERTIYAFCFCFNKYWGSEHQVTIIGNNPPEHEIPDNFRFYKVTSDGWDRKDYTNGLIPFFWNCGDDQVLWLLDDYWINKPVDHLGIMNLSKYMQSTVQPILRMDLTRDRECSYRCTDIGRYGGFDLIKSPKGTPYQMSLQAGIWDVQLLLRVLQPGWDPWEVELIGSGLVDDLDMVVMGTRNNPVSYTNALNNVISGINLEKLEPEIINEMRERGYINA